MPEALNPNQVNTPAATDHQLSLDYSVSTPTEAVEPSQKPASEVELPREAIAHARAILASQEGTLSSSADLEWRPPYGVNYDSSAGSRRKR